MPDPQDCSRYYIFFTFTEFQGYSLWVNDYAPHYAILDLSKSTPGILDISSVENTMLTLHSTGSTLHHFASILPDYPITVGGQLRAMGNVNYAALKNTNGSGYLIFISLGAYDINNQATTSVFTCLLDDCGFSYTGNQFVFDDAPSFGLGYGGMVRTQLEAHRISNGNIRIGLAMGGKLFTNQLNSSGQTIANQINSFVLSNTPDADSPIIKGLEFFGDNHLYYLNTYHSSILSVFNYIDFNNIQNGPQPIFGIPTISDFQYSMIESDGSTLLMVGEGSSGIGNRLGRWTIPSDPNNSTFVDNYIDFSQYPIPISNYSGQAVLYTASSQGGNSINSDGHLTKLYHLPDQIDGYNYQSRFEESMSCCIANKEFNIGAFIASSANAPQSVWSNGASSNPFNVTNGIITIAEELRIPAGRTIEIQNMELRFAKGARIVIENGADGAAGGVLELKQCVLTNDSRCGDVLWQGIEVWGNPNFWQGGANNDMHPQGTLIMSGCEIKNACRGILTGKTAASVQNFNQFDPLGNPICSNLEYTKSIGCAVCPDVMSGFGGGIVDASQVVFENNVTDVEMRDYICNSQFYPNSNPAIVLVNDKSRFDRCKFWSSGFLHELNLSSEQHVLLHRVFRPTFQGCNFINFLTDDLISIEERGIGINCQNAACRVIPFGDQGAQIDVSTSTIFRDLHIGIQTTTWNTSQPSFVYKSIFENNKHGVFGFGAGSVHLVKNRFHIRDEDMDNYFASGTMFFGCNNYRIEENEFVTLVPFNDQMPFNSYGTIIMNSGENNNEVYKNTYYELTTGVQLQGINGQLQSPTSLVNAGLRVLCNEFSKPITEYDIIITSGRIAQNQGFCSSVSGFPAGNTFSNLPPLSHFEMGSNVEEIIYYHDASNEPTINIPLAPQFQTVSCSVINSSVCISKAHPIFGWAIKPQKRERLDLIGRSIDDLEYLLSQHEADSALILAEISFYEAEHEQVIREMISELFNDDSLSNYLDEYVEILELGRTVYHKMILGDLMVSIGDSARVMELIDELEILAPNRGFSQLLQIQNELSNQLNPLEYARNNANLISVLWQIALDEKDPVNKERAEVLLHFILGEPLNITIESIDNMNMNSQLISNVESEEIGTFVIYPNPTNGMLFVSSELDFENGEIQIFSLNGISVFSSNLKTGMNRLNISNTENQLSSGIYFVIIKTNQGLVQYEKLIIE